MVASRGADIVTHHKKTYLTSDGKLALAKAATVAAGIIGVTAFLVAPRRRDWRTTAQWKQIEKHRYAHRGLFEEPPSAQAYPKGTAGDPWKNDTDLLTMPDKVVQFADKIKKRSDAPVATPLWAEDVKHATRPIVPENSLPAFRAAAEAGYGVELDVRLTKDNVLVVVHDSDLERLCGRAGFVEQLTHEELCEYHLLGTDERIPTLEQVLSLFETAPKTGARRPPLIIEIKSTMSNYVDLTRMTMLALDHADVSYCIESFDPRVLSWLRHNRPDVFRGQLSEDSLADRGAEKYGIPMRWILSSLFANVLSRPDFVAYKYSDRHNLFVWLCRRVLRGHLITWTVRSDNDLAESEREGAPAIFEYIRPDTRSRLSK